jgi:hypothetical protein
MKLGRPLSVADNLLEATAKSLAPESSLQRIETHAKYLFSTVTVFGTLVTGFGLFSSSAKAGVDPHALLWPITLVCLSFTLSTYAMTPSAGRLNVNDLVAVRLYFERRVFFRGIAIFIAGLLFAAALLVVVPIAARATVTKRPLTALTLKETHDKDGKSLGASIKITDLPANVIVDVDAAAVSPAGETPLFRQRSQRREGGELTVDFSVSVKSDIRRLRVTVTGSVSKVKIVEDTISLDLPPR